MAFSPDGTKIVSGSIDETIKVWDANPVPFDPSDWDKAEPDDDGDILWTNAKTAEERWQYAGEAEPSHGELCAESNLTRSKPGILVRFGPQIAPPWPKLTISGFPGRHTRAEERED